MNVVRLPDLTEKRPRKVAIGTFDGVHVGHREVIRGCDTVLTFDPHPLSVVRPEAAPKLLTTFNVKRDIIGGLGVEELVVIPFDEGYRETSAEQLPHWPKRMPPQRRDMLRTMRSSFRPNQPPIPDWRGSLSNAFFAASRNDHFGGCPVSSQ